MAPWEKKIALTFAFFGLLLCAYLAVGAEAKTAVRKTPVAVNTGELVRIYCPPGWKVVATMSISISTTAREEWRTYCIRR